MTVIKCDICGKDIGTTLKPIRDYNFCISSHGTAWDVCDECRDELREWIVKRKAQKGTDK